MEKEKDKIKDDRSICRALITPSESEDYDFECVAAPSENKQLKYSWQNGEYFYQVLRTKPENIVTDRLESGLPIFDRHPEPEDQTATNTLGISVSYEITDAGIVLRMKHGARADEALKSDVKNGVIKTVSIEGSIINYSIERAEGKIPIYYADLWEPECLGYAPVPNDIGAQIEVKRALARQIEESKPSFINSLTKNIKR